MRFLHILILSFLTASCGKSLIDYGDLIDQPTDLNNAIVIDGMFTTEKTIHQIKLTKAVSLLDVESSEEEIIDDAEVKIIFEGGEHPFYFDDQSGLYLSGDSIAAIPGIGYTLEVDVGSQHFHATDYTPLNSNNYGIRPFRLSQTFDDSEDQSDMSGDWIELDYYQHNFGYEKPFILIANEVGNLEGVDETLYNSIMDIMWQVKQFKAYLHLGNLPQGVLASSITKSGVSGFKEADIQLIYLDISEAYYNYLLSKFNETDWKFGIFNTVAANVNTNVSANGYGYFSCVNVTRVDLKYHDLIP